MLVLAFAACPKPADPAPTLPPDPAWPVTLHVAATNDFHGGLYENAVKGEVYGGLPWLVAAVRTLRAEDPDLLLLDGGDEFQGSWPVNRSQGMGSIRAMQLLGLDAGAIGNHEFDYGPRADGVGDPLRGAFEAAAAEAGWFTAANIHEVQADGSPGPRWQPPGVKPWRVVEKKGLRIGVVGLSTIETPTTTRREHVAGLVFADPVEEVRALLPELAASDLDVTVLVAHLTGECEPKAYAVNADTCTPTGEIGRLLTELPVGTFDVMVLGHAHTVLHHRVGDTFLLEQRSGGALLGRLDLVVGPDGVDADASVVHEPWALHHAAVDPGCEDRPFPMEAIDVGGRSLAPDPDALALVDRLEAESGTLCEEIACASRVIERKAEPESELGDWMADALLAAFPGADLALQNAGGIRADLPAGKLRREQLQKVMPFDNRAMLVELTGAEIVEVFRIGTSGAHGVMQLSGGRVTADPKKEASVDRDGDGEVEEWEADHLCGVEIGGKPVDPARTYQVVVSDFLYGGGDHQHFGGAPVLATGALVRDILADAAAKTVGCLGEAPPPGPRIVAGSCR